jgi:tetratricopeptide (TPR) repeat protein
MEAGDGSQERSQEERRERCRAAFREGRVSVAREEAHEALLRAAEKGDTRWVAAWLDFLGDVAQRTGDVEGARRDHLAAMSVYRQLGSDAGQGDVELSMGFLAERIGQLPAAREHFENARDAFQRAGREGGVARALTGLAGIAALAGERERAKALYSDALDLCQRAGTPQDLANVRYGMLERLAAEEPRQAIARLEQLGADYARLGDPLGVANCRFVVASALGRLGDVADAERHASIATRLYGELETYYGKARSLELQGELALRAGDSTSAFGFFLAGQADAERAGRRQHAAWLKFRAGSAMVDLGSSERGFAMVVEARQELADHGQLEGAAAEIEAWMESARRALSAADERLRAMDVAERAVVDLIAVTEHDDRWTIVLEIAWSLLCSDLKPPTPMPPFSALLDRLAAVGAVSGELRDEGGDPQPYCRLDPALARAAVSAMQPARNDQLLELLERVTRARFLLKMTVAATVATAGTAIATGNRLGRYLRRRKQLKAAGDVLAGVLAVAHEQGAPESPTLRELERVVLMRSDPDPEESIRRLRAGRFDPAIDVAAFKRQARQAGLLLALICTSEEDDRMSMILDGIWRGHCSILAPGDEPPDPWSIARELDSHRLISATRMSDGGLPEHLRYQVDAAIVRLFGGIIDADLFRRLLASMAAAWTEFFERNAAVPERQTVRAGIGAALYAYRCGGLATAFHWLEGTVLPVARRTGEHPFVLEHLRRLSAASGDPQLVARFVVAEAGPEERNVARLSQHIERLALEQQLAAAVLAASVLFEWSYAAGLIEEAFAVAETALARIHHGGLGAWSRGTWNERRLNALYAAGRHREILDSLPAALAAADEARLVAPTPLAAGKLREQVLYHALGATKTLGEWSLALELNADRLASLEARQAGEVEIADGRFHDYAALLELGDGAAAERRLLECQDVFERAAAWPMLGTTLGARAIVAGRTGAHAHAVTLAEQSLRTIYRAPLGPECVASAHHRYGNAVDRVRGEPPVVTAHCFAAALLYCLAGRRHQAAPIVVWIRSVDPGAVAQLASSDVDELVAQVERLEGVRLGALLRGTWPDRTVAACLREIASLQA